MSPKPLPDQRKRAVLGRWIVSTGPNAVCDACPWYLSASMSDPADKRRVMSAARFHVRDTGHSVQINEGRVATYSLAADEEQVDG